MNHNAFLPAFEEVFELGEEIRATAVIQCLKMREDTVLIKVESEAEPRLLTLK
jgi:hypothetical protein